MSDIQKWKARSKPTSRFDSISDHETAQNGILPCFFIVPSGAAAQPVVSGSVGDCLLLLPDGRRLDLFEVSLWTGGLIPVETDLFVPDTIPLAFTRTYRPIDDWSKRFHVYAPHVYDPYLLGDRFPFTYAEWDLPDVLKINYRRVSPGHGYADAVFESDWPIPIFRGSRINWNGDGWDLALPDGTTYLTPEAYSSTRPSQSSLVAIFDKEGREARLSRKRNGDLTEIKSPSGGWIRLTYSEEGRFVQASDNLGNTVEYDYDSGNRLGAVRYSDGRTAKYYYDAFNRMIEAENPLGVPILKLSYDLGGKVTHASLGSGSGYDFEYVLNDDAQTSHVDIVDWNGTEIRVAPRAAGAKEKSYYSVEKRAHVRTHL